MSSKGKYKFNFWVNEGSRMVREEVIVDEYLPVGGDGRPVMSKPNGNELWVMLLEKAMAKYMGGYTKLDGGICAFAFMVFTGDPCFFLKKQGAQWKRSNIAVTGTPGNRRLGGTQTSEQYNEAATYDILKTYNDKNGILACSAHGAGTDSASDSKQGIVQMHAYAILRLEHPKAGPRMICLRNPWGERAAPSPAATVRRPQRRAAVRVALR